MAFPTTPEETLKYFLFKVMSEEDATRFMGLKEVLAACEAQEPKWQAVYALSTHLHVLASYKTSIEFSDYPDKHAVGFKDFLRILAPAQSEESHQMDAYEWRVFEEYCNRPLNVFSSLTDKLLVKHELEYTPWWFLFRLYSGEFFSFSGAVGLSEADPRDSDTCKETISQEIDSERYPFVGYAKLMAANTLIPMLLKQNDYESAIEAMTKVAECLPIEDVFLKLEELVDKWLNLCENIPLEQPAATKQTGALANGEYQWVSLVDSVAAITGLAGDMTNESIDRCFEAESLAVADKHSGDFWAWKYGYIVGRLALAVRPIPQRMEKLLRYGGVGDHSIDGWPNGHVMASLLFGCDPAANYFALWVPGGGYKYLTEVAPVNGLYWAMRVGFANAMRGKAVAVVPKTGTMEKEIITSIGIRQVKHDLITNEKLDEIRRNQRILMGRSRPSAEEIETYLLETLDDTFDRLPLQVRDHLKQAELDFKSGTRQSNARVEFVKSVEAALDCLFIAPLRSYYKQYKLGWPFMVPSPDGTKHEYVIRKWGEQLCNLAQPTSQQLGVVNTPSINRFLKEYYPNLNYCELEVLGKSLQDVQKLRGGSAHYQSQFPLHKEIEQLKELRNIVLGLEGHTSVIRQIFELFGNKRGTA